MKLSARLPGARRFWARPWHDSAKACVSHAGTHELSGLGKLAFASLWLLAFAIPWEDAITIPGFGTSARLIGVITVVLGLIAIVEKGTLRRPAPGHFLLALFVMSAAASYLWSLYPEGTLTQTITYIQLLTLVWLIWELCPGTKEQQAIMKAYVLGTFVSGIDTICKFFSHQQTAYQRYAGSGLDANDLGLMMALSIPVSYCLLLQEKGPMAWVYRLQLALAGITIMLTASRGATLACLVALVIVPLTHARMTVRMKVAMLVTLSLLVAGAVFLVPASSWKRLSTVPNEFEHGTFTGRTIIWKAGWQIFGEHPYLGIGANAFRVIVSRVLREPIRLDDPDSPAPPAHNTFLSVLVEQGVFGFAVFCTLLAVLALSLRAMPPLPQRMWMVVLAVWGLGVLSLTWEMRKPTWFFFGLLIAQSGSMVQERRVSHRHCSEPAPERAAALRLSWSSEQP